ncbi:hypothetical protein [Hyella patelloides]|uniref:hypothetical protein n=1 Tax=Hyella patelloides TaxID=1982969 RepID=UPI00119D0DD2|nr:hypothetical protein [Hyella patelloides]
MTKSEEAPSFQGGVSLTLSIAHHCDFFGVFEAKGYSFCKVQSQLTNGHQQYILLTLKKKDRFFKAIVFRLTIFTKSEEAPSFQGGVSLTVG